MDYEKRYNEALERARQIKNGENGWGYSDLIEITPALEEVFPELAESERIRKEIVECIEVLLKQPGASPRLCDWLAWLEKQKEPQNKSMAHEDCSRSGILTSPLCKDKNLDDIAQEYVEGVREYNPTPDWNLIHTAVCYGYHLAEQKEQKPAGVYVDCTEHPEWYGMPSIEQKPAEWSKNDTAFLNEITDFFENKTVRLQHDIDMYAHWLKSLPERFVLQPKPEWSEEDEEHIKSLLARLEGMCKKGATFTQTRFAVSEDMDWLKSLRPQPKVEWSDEDEKNWKSYIERLESEYHKAPNVVLWDDINWLKSLHERLKSLRPSWKPSEDEERLINTSISFLKDFADKGYENAVECIDFLKSKLNEKSIDA